MDKDVNVNINDQELINGFGEIYNIAKEVFEVEPIEASPKVQSEIRKWICKNSNIYKVFPFINKQTDDKAIIEWVYSLNQRMKEETSNTKRFFGNVTEHLGNEVVQAFLSLIDYNSIYSKLEQYENNIKIPIDYCASYDRFLTLIDCDPIVLKEYDCIDFSGSTFSKNDEYYTITALLENYDTETSSPLVFRFKNAKVEINSYDATETGWYFQEPWTMLDCFAKEIIEKSELSFELLNKKEKNLLPLLKEFKNLDFFEPLSNEFEKKAFPLIKAEATNFAMNDFVALLDKFEQVTEENKEYKKLLNKIHQELQKTDYEPLWRHFYALLSDSQKDYPKKADAVLSKEYIEGIRSEITSLMNQNGYIGNYPNFSKTADLKSICTADCHGEPFTMFREKNAKLYISCIEDVTEKNKINIMFLTGTALNKKDVVTTDAFSCLFYKRGKIFNNSVVWDSTEETEKELKQIVNIAFKKAELKKLTKEERKLSTPFGNGCLPLHLGMGVIFGGLFTILFSICFFFFVLFLEGFNTATDMIKTFPWWQCFIASGGLFGIAMFLISLHTQRK